MKSRIIITLGLLLCGFTQLSKAQIKPDSAYRVETITMPNGLTAETGGVCFLPDGRLAACFIRGEVMLFDPKTSKWSVFAKGLHEPLGVMAVSNTELLVMQRPELTRLKDTNGDGVADEYETVTDGFGLSRNYHEFAYGPVKDKQGNLYFALNTASPGGNVAAEIRGEFNPLGRDQQPGLYEMYSVVPYRGWVMKVTPGGKLTPYASGFRSPNGIGFDKDDNLFVNDNQSDWVETGAMYHVREGRFYGHPGSLVWREGWNRGTPYRLPIASLDSLRTKAAILFPQGIMANSPSQPLTIPAGKKFGPFGGQLLVGEMNRDRIVRIMLEKVGGEFQGACISFLDGHGLRKGNNRLAFAADGSLWVGQIAYGWSGDLGIQHINFTGKAPMDVYSMNLTRNGFTLTFTEPVDAKTATNPATYKFRHYYYKYRRKDVNEGADKSTQWDLQEVPVTKATLSADGRKVTLTLGVLKPGYVYELKLGDVVSAKGSVPLANKLICYTLNKLLD